MNRHSTFVLITLISLLAAGCSIGGAGQIGSGHAATESRVVDNFTTLRVGTAIAATVIVGPDVTVSVTADDNLLPNVSTSVTAGRLTVEMQGSNTPRTPVTIAITVPSIERLEAWSAGSITATGINTGTLRASADSAGSIVATGNATSVEAAASSAGRADLGGVPAQSAEVNVNSMGRVTVNAQQSVTGNANSGGVATIEGNPPTLAVTTDSGGSVVRD